MKTLKTLVKFHKQVLDDKRRMMAGLVKEKTDLEAQLEKMHQELLKEQRYVLEVPETAAYYTVYAENMAKKQDSARKKLGIVEQKISRLNEEINESFGELKKHEILLEQKEVAAQHKIDQQEIINANEIATNIYLKNQENSDN